MDLNLAELRKAKPQLGERERERELVTDLAAGVWP